MGDRLKAILFFTCFALVIFGVTTAIIFGVNHAKEGIYGDKPILAKEVIYVEVKNKHIDPALKQPLYRIEVMDLDRGTKDGFLADTPSTYDQLTIGQKYHLTIIRNLNNKVITKIEQ